MKLTNTEVTILEDDMGLEVRTGYSGRGMYGEVTQAIVADSKDYVISLASDYINTALCDGDTGRVDELNVIIGKVARASQDSLGRDSIVIY